MVLFPGVVVSLVIGISPEDSFEIGDCFINIQRLVLLGKSEVNFINILRAAFVLIFFIKKLQSQNVIRENL